MRSRSYFVYIMTNRSGTLYTGFTNHLQRRILEHRAGLGAFTNKYRLVKLVYFEVFDDPYLTIAREKQIKGWLRKRKTALIESLNPAWEDLAEGWVEGK